MYKNILTWCFSIVVATIIVCVSYYTAMGARNAYHFYKDMQNQEEQLEELYKNQAFILSVMGSYAINTQDEIEEIRYDLFDLREEINSIRDISRNANSTTSFLLESQSKEIKSQNSKIANLALHLAKTKKESIIKETLDGFEYERTHNKPSYDYLESVTVYMFNRQSEDKGVIGTGIIVKQNSNFSYIITNKHVCNENSINRCNIIIYKYGESVAIPLKFVRQTESKYDLSLWKTSEFLPYKRAIKGLSSIKKSEKVYSVGNYLGYKYIYTEGTFAGYDQGGSFIFNLPCNRGCSGSGVYNKDGKLVSLLFAVDYINFFQTETSKVIGIPPEILRLFLRNLI